MPTSHELEAKFWKALKSDMTMMLGLNGVEDGHARPMTAQVEADRGPIWFVTARDNALVQNLANGDRAIATFTSKGHDLFANHSWPRWLRQRPCCHRSPLESLHCRLVPGRQG